MLQIIRGPVGSTTLMVQDVQDVGRGVKMVRRDHLRCLLLSLCEFWMVDVLLVVHTLINAACMFV